MDVKVAVEEILGLFSVAKREQTGFYARQNTDSFFYYILVTNFYA